MFTIDKNVPPPDGTDLAADLIRWPFGKMEMNDSVLLPADGRGNQSKPATAARQYGRRNGKRFMVRSIDKGAQVRIWRVE